MAKIRLLANVNCDHVLSLAEPLLAGGRISYQDQGRRLGGGAANTGVGLVWAGHEVSIMTRLGDDATADWLLDQAQHFGLDTQYIECVPGETGELLLLVDSEGERTILRQPRPAVLPKSLPLAPCDCLYVNYDGEAVADYMSTMLSQCLVVSQYPRAGQWLRPCHIMIASAPDLALYKNPWRHAQQIAGNDLRWLIITDGDQGATAFCSEQQLRVPALPVTVVDTTGAGDTFAAGLIHALLANTPMQQALTQASTWAAYTLSVSSSIPSEQLKDYLHTTLTSDLLTSHC